MSVRRSPHPLVRDRPSEPPAAGARADEALRAERDFSAAVLDTIANLVVVLDPEARIVRFNRACERAAGYAAAQVLGRSVFDFLIPEEDLPGARETFERLRAGDFPNAHRNRWRAKDGSERLIDWTNTAIPGEDGRIRFVIATGVDVTERERTAEAFATLADNIAQLAWMADEHGAVFWYNRRWFEYTGTTLDEVKGSGWRRVHHPDHLERVAAEFTRCVAAGEAWEDTFPLRGKDGGYRWFLSRALPIRAPDGHVVRWFGTNTDVTEQRAAEEALRETDRRRTEFLGVLSHELRNPLAPIRNGIFLLDHLPPDSAAAARARQAIRRQTDHLARLVDDLLDVTRISRGKILLQRATTDLREVVRRTCEDHRSLFEQGGIELALDLPAGPVWADVDATRVTQAVGNLLANAAKFTPAGGDVTVRLRARDGRAEIRVKDTGTGIAPEQVARLFEPFAQEDRTLARSRGGLGLGLALSRGLVEAHGGTVRAHSDGPGKGAEVVVELPVAPAPPGVPPSAERRGAGPRRRILLVDDNADAARTLADVLEVLGHEVSVAADGASGVARARALRPDVVICDLGLPDVNGFEVARTLRADEALRETRFIALSGYGAPEDKLRALEAGFEVHLTRPAPLDELADLLARPPARGGAGA